MVEKIKMDLGYHKDSANACFGCMSGGSIISANALQATFLIIHRLDKNGERKTSEPYCLSCSLLLFDKLKQQLFASQKDSYYEREHKKLSDHDKN